MKPLLIGLSGKSGSGKDAAGEYLAQAYGYHRFAFADALKQVLGIAFRFSEAQLWGGEREAIDWRWGVSPRECLQWLGTEVFRARFPDIWIRRLRQDIMDFLAQNGQRPIVVTDVRFRDEALALKRMGAVLIRLEREIPPAPPLAKGEKAVHRLEAGATREEGGHVGPPLRELGGEAAGHVSETDLDGWEGWRDAGNYVLDNRGNLGDLYQAVDLMLAAAWKWRPRHIYRITSGPSWRPVIEFSDK